MHESNGYESVLSAVQLSGNNCLIMIHDTQNKLSNFKDRVSGIDGMLPRNLEAKELPTEVNRESKTALELTEEVLLKLETVFLENTSRTMIFDSSSDEGTKYLGAVDEMQNTIAFLSLTESNITENRAQNIFQVAMLRLQEEFRHLLATHSEPLDPDLIADHLDSSLSLNPEKATDLESQSSLEVSITSNYHELSGDVDSQSSGEEEEKNVPVVEPLTDRIIDLLPPEVVKNLHEIAQRMVSAGFQRECCQVYGSARKSVLEESLGRLGFEKLSIDEVHKMTWEALEVKIRKWIQTLNVGVKVLYAGERQLCENIFNEQGLAESCFAEISRASITHLLNFGEAIAVSRTSPEKLFKVLDMYETLRDLVADLSAIFSGESFAGVREEVLGILSRLVQTAKRTFAEFGNAISRDTSRVPVPGGAVHPLTRYVMNYASFLFDYADTLKQLFADDTGMPEFQGDGERISMHDNLSPLALHSIRITHVLQSNLDEKSKLYKDHALTYLFLMNNVRYIVQKVKDSDLLRALLGDDWLRKHTSLVRKYATDYQRSAWNAVLACLKDEGIRASGSFSNGVSKAVLKERFKSFNAAFEDILKAQSSWLVPDSQLRLELRISIAEKLLPAYRSFLGRYRMFLESEKHSEKYIKYTPEDLEARLNDFFEGRTSSSHRFKSTNI